MYAKSVIETDTKKKLFYCMNQMFDKTPLTYWYLDQTKVKKNSLERSETFTAMEPVSYCKDERI